MLSIRQSPLFGGLLIVLGIVLLVLGSMLPEGMIQILLGLMNVGIGILILTNPVILIDDTHIQLRNLLGMTMRRVEHGGLQNLEIEGKRVYIVKEGERKKVKNFNGSFCHPGDWKVMLEAVETRKKL